MATWNSRGLRGSTLEDMINKTWSCSYPKDSDTDNPDKDGSKIKAYYSGVL